MPEVVAVVVVFMAEPVVKAVAGAVVTTTSRTMTGSVDIRVITRCMGLVPATASTTTG